MKTRYIAILAALLVTGVLSVAHDMRATATAQINARVSLIDALTK